MQIRLLKKDCGAIKVINGNMGPGILNALYGANQAMEMADKYGIGMVGLKNTTHWMRGAHMVFMLPEKVM